MAKKASENLKYYQNPNGPAVAVVSRKVIEKDGLFFKDIDGTGEVTAVNDWRLSPEERAEAYVKSRPPRKKSPSSSSPTGAWVPSTPLLFPVMSLFPMNPAFWMTQKCTARPFSANSISPALPL